MGFIRRLLQKIGGNNYPQKRDVLNAFQPGTEIKDVSRFSGRRASLERLYDGLLSDGGNFAIIGNRGLGKSSLANQLKFMAMGDLSILKKMNINSDHKPSYTVILYSCGDTINGLSDYLQTILNLDTELSEYKYKIDKDLTVSTSIGGQIQGFGISGSVSETSSNPVQTITVQTYFTNIVNRFRQEIPNEGLLLIIDEFDKIKDKSGFGSFIKTSSTNISGLRFCLVGVAEDLHELLDQHASITRVFDENTIKLQPMSPEESEEIITNAEKRIDNKIIFSTEAKQKIIYVSGRYPYLVHLYGKFSLKNTYSEKRNIVTVSDVEKSFIDIVQSSEVILEKKYSEAVVTSYQREIVLHDLANAADKDGVVHLKNITKHPAVKNYSAYCGHMASERHGSILKRLDDGVYKFQDDMFSHYVRNRPKTLS